MKMLQPRCWLRPPLTLLNCTYSPPPARSYATAGQRSSTDGGARAATKAAPSSTPPRSVTSSQGGTFAIRTYTPRTPGVRHLRRPINDHLWKGRPFRPLTLAKKGQGKGGRNHTGRIMVRHRGGGHKRRIRMLDYARKESGKHTVERIEHDPNRSAHIALLTNHTTGRKSYIVAAEGMRAGDTVESYLAGIPADLLESMGGVVDPGMVAARTAWRGNCLPLHMVPVGAFVYNVGSRAERGAVFCRSAGTHATVVAKDQDSDKGRGRFVTIKLQSGEVRKVSRDACATVGVASNGHHRHRQLGKAGRKRWLGIRPTVRGVAMNAVDHPHGGGRGKSKGNVHPVSIWGTLAKSGFKTRNKRNPNKLLVTDRPRNQGKRRKPKNS
ncbi:MAG: hypothetical protein M1815_000584 [Lichina confinis]|nr:MAG: hypothetical protein M1815_000584 [Lichina confinis]